MPCTSLSSHLPRWRDLTFLNDVPMSLKLGIIESFNFKNSRLDKISPVTYRLWNLVSTRSSILGRRANSLCSTPSYWDKNFSLRSTTSHTSSDSMISNSFSWMFSKALFMFSFSDPHPKDSWDLASKSLIASRSCCSSFLFSVDDCYLEIPRTCISGSGPVISYLVYWGILLGTA